MPHHARLTYGIRIYEPGQEILDKPWVFPKDVGRERAPRDRAHHRVRQVTMTETVGEWKENMG